MWDKSSSARVHSRPEMPFLLEAGLVGVLGHTGRKVGALMEAKGLPARGDCGHRTHQWSSPVTRTGADGLV